MFKEKVLETVIGFVILLVAAIFIFYAQKKAGLHEIVGYTLVAKFDRADGIRPGTDVKVSGIKVGFVTSAKIDPVSYLAIVEMRIDSALPIPIDSSVSVSTDGILGGKHLAITPGGDTEVLRPGDEVKYTQGSINLESLLSKFMFSSSEQENLKKEINK